MLLFNRKFMLARNLTQTFYVDAGYPQEQSPSNKWFSSKSSKKVILMLSSEFFYDFSMLLGY
jgi:hypothetical protein